MKLLNRLLGRCKQPLPHPFHSHFYVGPYDIGGNMLLWDGDLTAIFKCACGATIEVIDGGGNPIHCHIMGMWDKERNKIDFDKNLRLSDLPHKLLDSRDYYTILRDEEKENGD